MKISDSRNFFTVKAKKKINPTKKASYNTEHHFGIQNRLQRYCKYTLKGKSSDSLGYCTNKTGYCTTPNKPHGNKKVNK